MHDAQGINRARAWRCVSVCFVVPLSFGWMQTQTHPLGAPRSLSLPLGEHALKTSLPPPPPKSSSSSFGLLFNQLFILHVSVLALTSSPSSVYFVRSFHPLFLSLSLSLTLGSRPSLFILYSNSSYPTLALSVSTRTSSLPKVWYLGDYILLCFRLIIPCTPFNWSCCFFLSFLSSLLTPPTVENAHPSPFFAPPLILLSALCLFSSPVITNISYHRPSSSPPSVSIPSFGSLGPSLICHLSASIWFLAVVVLLKC